jgi:hypothetical protein
MRDFLTKRLYDEVEGTCSGRFGYIISVVDVVDIGRGILQSTSGFAEFTIIYKAIVFKPFKNQVVDGVVTTVNRVRYVGCFWNWFVFTRRGPSLAGRQFARDSDDLAASKTVDEALWNHYSNCTLGSIELSKRNIY